jgi:hypothetical protein
VGKGPETKLKERVMPKLRSVKGSWWIKNQMVAIRGLPDILGTVHGFVFAIELKSGNKKPTPLQAKVLSDIASAGGRTFFINEENEKEMLEKIMDEICLLAPDNPLEDGKTAPNLLKTFGR